MLAVIGANPGHAQTSVNSVSVTGEASVEVEDYFEEGFAIYRYFVEDAVSGVRTEVFFPGEADPAFETGNVVTVSGLPRSGSAQLDFQSIELIQLNPESEFAKPMDSVNAPVAGPEVRKVLTLITDFQDAVVYDYTTPANTPNGPTVQDVKDRMFHETKNVADFYYKASLGTLTMPSDPNGTGGDAVYGPYLIPYNYLAANPGACQSSVWVNAALDAWEADTGQSRTDYRHHSLILPNYWDYSNRHCGFGGQAQVGCGTTCWAVNADPVSIMHGVIIHEIGHNYGMLHASTDLDNNGTNDCEYCDNSDMMGGSRNWMKFNPPHFEYKGWYDPDDFDLRSITPTTTLESYVLVPVDDNYTPIASHWNALRALKTPRTASTNYYFSYRQQSGDYNNVTASYTTGASLHWRSSSSQSFYVRSIDAGEVFTDASQDLIVLGIGPETVSEPSPGVDSTQGFRLQVCSFSCSTLIQPLNLVAKGAFPDEILLSWEDLAHNEDGFEIDRSTDGSSWSLHATVAPDSTSYLDFGLSPGSTFHYRVRAYRGTTEFSDWSNTDQATTPLASGTIGFRIAAGDDDVEEFTSGSMWLTSSYINIGLDAGNGEHDEGLRFTGVSIPQGSTINSAYIEYRSVDNGSGSSPVVYRSQDVDDAEPFTSTNFSLTGRTFTTQSVPWSPGAWSSGVFYQTPDLTTIIQPIINRPGWSADNALVVISEGTQTGSHRAWSYNGQSANAPILVVDYNWFPPGNQAPTAGFNFTTYNRTATFTDTSTDNDGSVVAWSWDFGDSNSSTAQNPVHNYAADGTYNVTLTVTDNDGDSDNISQMVTVEQDVTPPVITVLGDNPYTVKQFTAYTDPGATALDNQDGDLTSSITDDSNLIDTSVLGNQTVTYNVSDLSGNAAMATRTVTVVANVPPTADFSFVSGGGNQIDFTDLSSDSDGTVVAWSWNFGDSNTSSAQNPSHTYATYGTYSVQLEVTDDNGDTGNVSKNVTVSPPCTASKSMPANQWFFFSLPCMPPDSRASQIFAAGPAAGDYGTTWILYVYDNDVGGSAPGYAVVGADTNLQAGVGYQYYATTAHSVTVEGDFNSSSTFNIPENLDPGRWSLMGNPHNGSFEWTGVSVTDGNKSYGFAQMDAKQGQSPHHCDQTPPGNKCYLWHVMNMWGGSSYLAYDGTENPATTIDAFDAFWVRSHRADSITIPPPAAPPAEAPLQSPYADAPVDDSSNAKKGGGNGNGNGGGKGGKSSLEDWEIRLVATAGSLEDAGNRLGQAESASDGFDSRDLEEWTPYSSPYLSILFSNPDFPAVDWGHTTDFRELGKNIGGDWAFVVRASSGVSDVTLHWQGDENLFTNATLVDEVSGESVTLEADGSYTFTMSGNEHAFTIMIR